MKTYGKRNTITGGTCLGNECSNTIIEKALCIARSTIASGYCRLMKKALKMKIEIFIKRNDQEIFLLMEKTHLINMLNRLLVQLLSLYHYLRFKANCS